MHKSFSLLLILVFISVSLCPAQVLREYNVLDFGAKGNGITDDTKAIQNCFNAAVKSLPATVRFPSGKYKIGGSITISYTSGDLNIKGDNTTQTLVFTQAMRSLFLIKGKPLTPQGSISIENISLEGNSTPFGQNPNFNTTKHVYGIGITDKGSVKISNVTVSNIYGRGINIANPHARTKNDNSRFKSVIINNCRIIDCWGHITATDSYGDGIYIADVQSAQITGNQVINDLNRTGYFGRAGIVLTYNAQNCLVKGNTVKGYDRGINIEYTYGGHSIEGNIFENNSTGVMVYETAPKEGYQKIKIINNKLSNAGLNGKNIAPALPAGKNKPMVGRSLLTVSSPDNCLSGSVISGNTFKLDNTNRFDGESIAKISASGIIIDNNSFNATGAAKSISVDIGKNSSFKNNNLNQVNIKISKSVSADTEKAWKSQNTMGNKSSIYRGQ